MGLARLSQKCRMCPYVETCDHKEMEALGFLPESKMIEQSYQTVVSTLAQPMLRETMEIRVDGERVVVYKDDILKQLERSLYGHLWSQGGV